MVWYKVVERNEKAILITDQLEVCNADCTLVVHLLLVFILNQTLHQVTCINLVVCNVLQKQ